MHHHHCCLRTAAALSLVLGCGHGGVAAVQAFAPPLSVLGRRALHHPTADERMDVVASSSPYRRPQQFLPRVMDPTTTTTTTTRDDAAVVVVSYPRVLLWATQSNEDGGATNNKDPEKDGDDEGSTKSPSRAGGRASFPSKERSDNKNKKKNALPGWLLPIVLPLLALWFAFQALFGSPSPQASNFVYYQSSVVESRSYDAANGQVKTTRKESVQSNLPSLLEQQQQKSRQQESSESASSFLLDQQLERAFDREIDREIEQEMQSMRRFQQSMLDDFF